MTAAEPVELHCDGDPVPAVSRIEVGLVPRALEIVVPAAAAGDPRGPFSGPRTAPPRPGATSTISSRLRSQ